MKIIYAGNDLKKRKHLNSSTDNIIVLISNNWDDFSFKTTFMTHCRINGNSVELGGIQILIKSEWVSSDYLDNLVEQGWDGIFPVPNTRYISTPAALSFYEQIEGHINLDAAIHVAQLLHDASYLTKIEEDDVALSMVKSTGFKKSLMREHGATKAYLDGWKLFGKESIFIGNQTFQFKSISNDIQSIELRYASDSPLPHDINVLIGPNGVGKSQLLHQIVKSWLELNTDKTKRIGFTNRPNLNQLVVVSYSPFELFPVDTSEDKDRKDHDVYKYYGLRGRRKSLTESKRGSNNIYLSRDFPKVNASRSLLACLADDQRYGAITDWSKKVHTMERVLRKAIDFDQAAVAVDVTIDEKEFFTDKTLILGPYIDLSSKNTGEGNSIERYVPVTSDRINELKLAALNKHVHDLSGVVFLKDGNPIHLSSGQRLFSYLVINILGAIRKNSLVLIDEPELFLHPTLEITFIRLLKSILSSYASKALIATHSLVVVREIPRNCIHVFEKTSDGVVVKTPPFETFGGDVQRISSYVFGDKSLSKPYEEWVRSHLEKYGSAEDLIAALGNDINEELLIQINAMEHGQW